MTTIWVHPSVRYKGVYHVPRKHTGTVCMSTQLSQGPHYHPACITFSDRKHWAVLDVGQWTRAMNRRLSLVWNFVIFGFVSRCGLDSMSAILRSPTMQPQLPHCLTVTGTWLIGVCLSRDSLQHGRHAGPSGVLQGLVAWKTIKEYNCSHHVPALIFSGVLSPGYHACRGTMSYRLTNRVMTR